MKLLSSPVDSLRYLPRISRSLAWLLFFPLILLAGSRSAFAVHDTGVFELDANAAHDAVDDFNDVYSGTSNAYDSVFIDDSANPDASHHEPSNKDEQGLGMWGCVVKPNVNNKLDLQHVYDATYNVAGEAVSFVGADRFTVDGDANIGVWFLQDKVACDPNGTGDFTGKKHEGDILLVSAFTGGGNFPSIDVYIWHDPTPLLPESGDEWLGVEVPGQNLPDFHGVDCVNDPHAVSPLFCGTANTSAISSLWRDPIPPPAFFEGGINLSQTSPNACFRTLIVETRSSQSIDATLFDLTLAYINTCGAISVEKVTDPSGDPQLFDFTIADDPPVNVNDVFQLKDGDPTHTLAAQPGNYTITEGTLPVNWSLTEVQCRGGVFGNGTPYTNGDAFALSLGDRVVCTFLNTFATPPPPPKITVDKVTLPASNAPQLFDFTLTECAGAPSVVDTFQLRDADPSHTTTAPPLAVGGGTYCIEETLPVGWDLTGVSCSGGPFGGGAAYTNGAPIVIGAGDEVTCTFVNTLQAPPPSASITVDKVILTGNKNQAFTFTVAGGPAPGIADTFLLDDDDPAHSNANLQPGTYTITETGAPANLPIICTGGPFGASGKYTNGSNIVLNSGNQVACTFFNNVRPAAANFCKKGPTSSALHPTSGRFPGNKGVDHLVRVDLGESIQAAVDIAADFNGDGYILIGVIANGSGAYGGATTQSLEINQIYSKPFGLLGCSVTLNDPTPANGQPTAHITPTASSPLWAGASLFVLDLHARGSAVAGWLVEGDNRYLRNVVGEKNNIGIWIVGDMNTFHGGEARSNTAQGVRVDGDLNTVIENLVVLNGDHGIQVTGDYNTVSKNRVGDLRQGNGGDGIHLEGAGNLLQGNTIFQSGGDGLEVRGGISTPTINVNVLKGNTIGDKGKGNSRHGLYLHGDVGNGGVNPIELEGNIVKASGLHGIFLDTGVTAHQLKTNQSGGGSGQDNGDCEFYVAAGNVNATGNKANGKSIAGSNNSPFPTGCIGTP